MSARTTNISKAVKLPVGIRIRGGIAVQKGVVMMMSFAAAGEIQPRIVADRFNPDTGEGYQREAQAPRVRQAAAYYRQGGRMPNPLLLNIREEDFDKVRVEIIGTEGAGFQTANEEGGDWIGAADVFIPEGVTVWVYDGQHRAGALKELLSLDRGEFEYFPVPVSITIGLSAAEELKEFYEVNNNAKAVKTDLAWELLRRMAADDPELAELLEEKGQDWKTRGADLADELVALGGIWQESIQEANVKKQRTDRLTLNKAQFIRSLQPVLAMPAFAKADIKTIARVLDAYWRGIAAVLPEPFAPDSDPKKWVIQKGPGAIAFHRVLPQVIEVLRAKGERLADPDAYAEVLKELPNLSGEIMYEDGTTKLVSGSDFWLAGPEGVASQWTGDAGRKRLAVRVQSLLPRPSDVLNL